LKCDGTRAETRFRLSTKRTSPFKSAGASVQSTTGSRGVRISGSNSGYTMFRGSVKGTGYPFHSPVSSSLPLPCVIVCHHISTGAYQWIIPSPKHMYLFRNKASVYSEDLLAPRPSLKLENNPPSDVHDFLFSMFTATLQIGDRTSIRNLRTRSAVVTGTSLSRAASFWR